MLPIPKDLTSRQTDRFQVLRDALYQAKKAVSEENQNRIANARFTRRDGMKAAGGSIVALAISSPVTLLSACGEIVSPQAGILMFMYQNWETLYKISRNTNLGFGYFFYGMGKYELLDPEMLDNEVLRIASAFYNYRHLISHQQTRKMPLGNELKKLLTLLKYKTEEERKEKREILVNMGLFTREIESEIKYHCKYRPYEEAKRIAENSVLEHIISAVEGLDRNISMSKWLIKCIKKHAPHLEAQQTVLERIFTEGPDFLETDPWFQAKKAELESESLEKKSAKKDPQKEQATKYKQELYEKFNYQVLLRSYNPKIDEYDQFVF